MKKRISLLLAVVMVLGSFSSVFANSIELSPREEIAAQVMGENDILVGNGDDLLLGENLIRQDSIVVLSRLLGAEDAAKTHPIIKEIEKFTDLPNNNYYKRNISWAVENEYYKGTSATKFSPKKALTAEEYAAILLRALGYTDIAWGDVYTKAEELGLLRDVRVEGAKDIVLRKDVALMTYNALETNVKGKNHTLAVELGIELAPVEDAEIKAISEKEIEVSFDKKLSKEEQAKVKFVVKDENGKEVALNPVSWNKDGNKAVIQRNYGLTFKEGKYTVEVKGAGADKKAEVSITKAKPQKLEIEQNVVSSGEKELKLDIKLVDQYGVKSNPSELTIAAKNLTTGRLLEVKDNKLVLNDKEGKSLVKEGDIISVTALDKGTALNVTKKIEVVAGSVVNELEMGDVIIVANDKVVDTYVTEDKPKAYVEVIALDQYGKKVDISSNDDIKFFATGLKNEVKSSEIKKGTGQFLDKDSYYIELSDKVKEDANQVSIYGVIVRSTGVQNSNVVKFDVVNAGGAVEFKLDGFEPVIEEKKEKEVKVKFFNKLGKETEQGKAVFTVKELGNKDLLIVDGTKITAKEIKDLSAETTIELKLEVDGKTVQTETVDIVITKPVAEYKAEITTDKDNFVAGEEIEVKVTAYSEKDKVHTGFNKTEAVEVEIAGQKYFRNANFVNGVATISVPVTKAQEKTKLVVSIPALKNVKATTDKEVVVKAGKVEKFILNPTNNKELLAVDKYDNTNKDYNKTEIVKKAQLKGQTLEEIDSEGNFKVDFKDGVMTLEKGLAKDSELKVTIDGIEAVIKGHGKVEDSVVDEEEEEKPEKGEPVSHEVMAEGERFDFETGFEKAVWVEVQKDGEPVGEGGMTEANGVAKINLTKAGDYKVVVKESKEGKVLKTIELKMTDKPAEEN